MIKQEEQRVVDGLVRDHMVVIQDEDDVSRALYEFIEQVCQDGRKRGSLSRVQQGKSRLPKMGQTSAQRCNDCGPEAARVIVQRIEGEPGDSLLGSTALCPLRPPLACLRDV